MSKEKILTKKLAEKFLNDNASVDLGEFTAIEDAAAQALAQHEGDLSLYGLTSLSEAAAQALAQHEGDLYLHGLTSLSDAAAEALAQHKGELNLDGLTSLSDAAAQALAQHEGDLSLDGLTSLSDAAAQAFAQHEGTLYLNGLTGLSEAAAQALAQHKGELNLGGLTSLSDAVAQALAQHEGELSLDGLTSLSDAAAQALAQHKGDLTLRGLTSLSEAAVQALAQHEGDLSLYGLTSLSEAAAQALAQHKGELDLDGEAEEALTAAKARLDSNTDEDGEDEDNSEEDDNDQSNADEEVGSVKLTIPQHNAINLLVRKAVALLVARDGQVTTEEQEWVESHWGMGAHTQIIFLAPLVDKEKLREELSTLLTDQAGLAETLKSQLEELSPLVSLDPDADEAELRSLIELADSFIPEEENAEEDSETEADPEALRLREALAGGDADSVRELIDELSLDQISEAIHEQNLGDAVGFLTSAVADNLAQINSPQFVLCGKPRVATLSEVAEKCGPIYGPFSTFSFGNCPPGWGAAASENRILSWADQGFGLVGHQVVNIADRYIVARPLSEFEGALIVGSLDDLELQEWPAENQVALWKGRPLTMDPFDPQLFREIFCAAMKSHDQLEWTYDFRGNAAAREALTFFIKHEEADKHADILLALAALNIDEEGQEKIKQALKLDPSLKGWADWIAAWGEFPENIKNIATLKNTDPLGSALATACQTYVDLSAGKKVRLDPLEAFVSKQYDPASPYLGWILARITRACVDKVLEGDEELEKGGDSAPYVQALRLGYRERAAIGWIMSAIKGGKNDYVRLCLESGFKPVGRFLAIYLNLLTTAANSQNIEAVQALLKHGADPDEPSHYGGMGTLDYGELQAYCSDCWPEEIMDALRAARKA